ncbi:hypothetical protein AJ78_03938 [Emergomyces pasteurianus Ep9510]|uniref:Uncharacterized protein n=1 Tax=Emergomyces pasteurianus Ep9510 TaxID=1447872 RepID=A0A1J9PHD0_9EURO|nr:hypothetical protein AJ78_03938 [Emergomyces pasteurianus Ep9510]
MKGEFSTARLLRQAENVSTVYKCSDDSNQCEEAVIFTQIHARSEQIEMEYDRPLGSAAHWKQALGKKRRGDEGIDTAAAVPQSVMSSKSLNGSASLAFARESEVTYRAWPFVVFILSNGAAAHSTVDFASIELVTNVAALDPEVESQQLAERITRPTWLRGRLPNATG